MVLGERLSSTEVGQPGTGTYVRHGYIFSSLAGTITKVSGSTTSLPVVSVAPRIKAESVPELDAIVTCKVSLYTRGS